MREEIDIDIGDGTVTGDGLSERLQALDDRRRELGDDRDELAARRQELAPVEAYVAARNTEFDQQKRNQEVEEKYIARDTDQLRRDIVAARREAARAQKEQLKDLAEEHKGQLSDLDSVAEELADFQKAGTGNV